MNISIDGLTTREGYAPMLKESIDHFLVEFRRGSSDFSAFGSIFFRLIQTMADPPLEIIWFYSAVTFHSSKATLQNQSKEVLIAKDLFQSLVSCSSQSNGVRKVAVLAPVVYELYNIMSEFSNSFLRREMEGLVEGIISYISICCGNDSEEQENGSDDLMVCFVDLIRVWTVDRVGGRGKFGDNLRLFLPLLSDEIRRVVNAESGVGFLAGVVMIEVFLLRLGLKFGLGVSTDVQKDMQNWAVQIIKGFHNFNFLDMLLRMLLEPSLPVTTLLSSEDEVLLRKVLYDAILLGEYSFLNSGGLTQLPDNDLKNLALIWLFVADNAIHFVRENGDHSKAISYIEAFSVSHLPNPLIKWFASQNCMEEKMSRPNISTPKALIKWLLALEDQGVRVFDQNVSNFHANAVICKSRVDYELPAFMPNGKNPKENSFFYNGNEGKGKYKVDEDQVMVDSTTTVERRKRKEETTNEGVARIKLVKYNFDKSPVGGKILPFSDDEHMEDMD